MNKSKYYFEPSKYKNELKAILEEIDALKEITDKKVEKIIRKYPKDGSKLFSKHHLGEGLKYLHHEDLVDFDEKQIKRLQHGLKMKPTRTISGVTTVTVLTKPFMCPGKCIFCPNDVRMPKSYIATEPGAQRALSNRFSPYMQTFNRLQALKNIGHPTEKIELLVLGGTWSVYPEKYQIWFIKECFRAMNEFGEQITADKGQVSDVGTGRDLSETNDENKTVGADHGLSITTRPIETEGAVPEPRPPKDEVIHPDGFMGERMQIKKYLESDYNDQLREKLGDLPYNKLVNTKEFKEDFKQFLCSEESALKPSEGWEDLKKIHAQNAKSNCRCVGLVLETRPDSINERETLRLRKLGATKIQLGIQTLDDEISELNERGEGRAETGKAFRLLRAAGFKIHAHMMPNLYGATVEKDLQTWKDLFTLPDYKPDEVKIYPTSTIKYTKLHKFYKEGQYKPYSTEELKDLIADMMENTPEYCRLTRIIRDIPSTEIEAGNKTTNLRQFVEWKLKKEGRTNPNIRAREIKDEEVKFEDLDLGVIEYETSNSIEYFLQYITKERKIAGFLRLSMPFQVTDDRGQDADVGTGRDLSGEIQNPITPELNHCAMIREVHVYGPSIRISKSENGKAQHIGLGSHLIEKAKEMVKQKGFNKLAVISAIGTREYYKKRGFELDEFYQISKL